MKERLSLLAKYFASWAVFFVVAKIIFLLYHLLKSSQLALQTLVGIFWYGFPLDLSFAAYLSIIPCVLVGISIWIPNRWSRKILLIYHSVITFFVTLIVVTDLEIYEAWGFRLDATPLLYLKNPQEALASAGASPIGLLLMIGILLSGVTFWWFKKIIQYISYFPTVRFWPTLPAILLAIGGLFIPIRGGFGLPINQSSAYFSSSAFANHAAINVVWNFFSSIVNDTYEVENPFQFLSPSEASAILAQLKADSLNTSQKTISLLKKTNQKPNILIIVWESLTAKVVERLGGKKEVTPSLERLTHEGILFNNFYASGDRSDKGLIAILSGFPAQPIGSIMTMPNKTAHLPSLCKEFLNQNYQTAFYYGGDPSFANIKSYLLTSGFQKLISVDGFPKAEQTTEWGVHDAFVFRRLARDIAKTQQPFFYTYFTLSSHEPFDVPMLPYFKGSDKATQFMNAHRYTDHCLDEFIEMAKKQPWWQNTLVIIVADHGHWLPEPDDKVHNFHIPMLWLGGALATKDTVIQSVASQTDIPVTLLEQLGYSNKGFDWSNNILNTSTLPYAYFAFHNGFGFIQPQKALIFDDEGKMLIHQIGNINATDVKKGQAYQQMSYDAFLKK